jgi:hypothetical protein
MRAVGPPFGPDSAGPYWTLVFSHDGRTLVSGSFDDTIRFWNVADPANPAAVGTPLPAQTGHIGNVTTVAFSRDGRLLASGGEDALIRLWNMTDPAHISHVSTLIAHLDGVNSVVLAPSAIRLPAAATTAQSGRGPLRTRRTRVPLAPSPALPAQWRSAPTAGPSPVAEAISSSYRI